MCVGVFFDRASWVFFGRASWGTTSVVVMVGDLPFASFFSVRAKAPVTAPAKVRASARDSVRALARDERFVFPNGLYKLYKRVASLC